MKITNIKEEHAPDKHKTTIYIGSGMDTFIEVSISSGTGFLPLVKRLESAIKREVNKNLDMGFVPEQYIDVFTEWVTYKMSKGQMYKSQKSLELCFKKLFEFSNGNEITMREIIEDAMSKNYAGFFKLKDNGRTKQNDFKQELRERLLGSSNG